MSKLGKTFIKGIEYDLDVIANNLSKGEPLDFASLHFDNPKVRENYRKFESFALEHIANRECVFCFNKSNENGMGGLSELERIGYSHSPCIEAFYEVGFDFKLIGFNDEINDYSWDILDNKTSKESGT